MENFNFYAGKMIYQKLRKLYDMPIRKCEEYKCKKFLKNMKYANDMPNITNFNTFCFNNKMGRIQNAKSF